MIDKMTKYSFVLLNSDKDTFLKKLQEIGVVDITRSSKPVDEHSETILAKMESIRADIRTISKGTNDAIEEANAEVSSLEKESLASEVWGKFNRKDLEKLADKGINLNFYGIESKRFSPEWEKEFALQIIAEKDGKTWFVVINPEGFPLKKMEEPRSKDEIEAELQIAKAKSDSLKAALSARKSEIPELERQYAELMDELNLYLAGATSESAAEDYLCTMTGFAPSGEEKKVCEELDAMPLYYIKESAKAEDNPPIRIKNNWFARQFEVFTGMYGMPVYDEFDPTPILAPFYLLFFSMCMGDAGYGILLMIIGLLLHGKTSGIGKFNGLIFLLGAGTLIVGLLFGTFFGINLTEMAWVPQWAKDHMITGDIMGYSAQMVLSLAIGVFHICLAMVVKSICYLHRFGFKKNISTLGWTLLIVGGVIVAVLALVGILPEKIVRMLLIGIGAISALGIFIFNKPGRNPLLNIGAGLWDTYGMVTGILGDVLSYIRLYALGLAGGLLGGAFNQIAEMLLGVNVPGLNWVLFIIILIFGHALNLAMSCLGAFVHPLRLTFVEYFKNSGYEGKGNTYKPLCKTN